MFRAFFHQFNELHLIARAGRAVAAKAAMHYSSSDKSAAKAFCPDGRDSAAGGYCQASGRNAAGHHLWKAAA